jgi:hypothetical protein
VVAAGRAGAWVACSAAAVAGVAIEKHTSAYVSIRQHTSYGVLGGCCCRCYKREAVEIRQHTSAYVGIRQHTSSAAAVAGVASEKPRGASCLLKDTRDAETYATYATYGSAYLRTYATHALPQVREVQ